LADVDGIDDATLERGHAADIGDGGAIPRREDMKSIHQPDFPGGESTGHYPFSGVILNSAAGRL